MARDEVGDPPRPGTRERAHDTRHTSHVSRGLSWKLEAVERSPGSALRGRGPLRDFLISRDLYLPLRAVPRVTADSLALVGPFT